MGDPVGLQTDALGRQWQATPFSALSQGDPRVSAQRELALDWGQTNLHQDPAFVPLMGRLFWIAAEETRQRLNGESQALLSATPSSQIFPWAQLSRRLSGSMGALATQPDQLQQILNEGPNLRGTPLANLQYIFHETDPVLFAESLLNLAQQLSAGGKHPALCQALLQISSGHPRTKARAEHLLQLSQGGGSFFEQLEFQAPHLLSELGSPYFLIPFALAGWSARWASLRVLSRAPRFTMGTWAASELAALGVEVPTLVLSRRLGLQLFAGGTNLWSPESVGHELLATMGPFAMLRSFGNAFQVVAPQLRQLSSFQNAAGGLNGLARISLAGGRFGTEVSAIAAGHGLNHLVGLQPEAYSHQNVWISSLLTAGHMRLAGGIIHAISPQGVTQSLFREQNRLMNRGLEDLFSLAGVSPNHRLRPRLRQEWSAGTDRGQLPLWQVGRWVEQIHRGQYASVGRSMQARGLPLLGELYQSQSRSRGEGLGRGPLTSGLQLAVGLSVPGGRNLAGPGELEMGPVFSMGRGDGSGGKGRGGKRAGESSEEVSPTRRELIRRKFAELLPLAEKSEKEGWTVRARARLRQLFEKANQDPESVRNDEFAQELEVAELELRNAQENEGKIQKVITNLRDLLDRNTPPEGTPLPQPSATPEPSAAEATSPPSFLARVGLWFQGAREAVEKRLRPGRETGPENPQSITTENNPPKNGNEARQSELEAIRDEVLSTERVEEEILEEIETLSRVQRLMNLARRRGWDEKLRERVVTMAARFGWKGSSDPVTPPEPDALPARDHHQEGAVLGLGVDREYFHIDSPLAHRLRQDSFAERSSLDMELEYLHYTVLEAAFANQGSRVLRNRIIRLGKEFEVDPQGQLAMETLGEGIHRLVRDNQDPVHLVETLRNLRMDGPLAPQMQLLKTAMDPAVGMREGLIQLGGQAKAANYLSSGLYMFYRSIVEPNDLFPMIRLGVEKPIVGFHPSIGLSLLGAYQGREALPDALFSPTLNRESFIDRAEAEYQEGSD